MNEAVPRSGALSDNEKAATFIGWNPDRCELTQMLPHHPKDWCPSHKRYETVAPDMSKPENYMRALGSLENLSPSVGYRNVNNGSGWYCEIDGSDDCCFYSSAGDAVVKALAALYDAQAATAVNKSTNANPKGD